MNSPPTNVPMLFTRTLERNLSYGAAITVRRSFEVFFEPMGAGFAVNGKQTDVMVSAPSSLESLAAIERERIDTKSFPQQLGSNGWIMGISERTDGDAMDKAIAQAVALIRGANLPVGDAAQAHSFLSSMQSAAANAASLPPADLFCPPITERIHAEEIAVSADLSGQIVISFSGEESAEGGLMRNALRRIMTTLNGESRSSIERWSLALQE